MQSLNRRLALLSGLLFLLLTITSYAQAQADLYMRDTASDTGVEPYTGAGPVYLSPDVWVRNEPDPNYDPYPFSTAAPGWTPAAHENPEYRDSKTSRPNYVYVRIHNRGSTASSGTERLRLYQSKASTGLSWPASWVDNVANACGADLLHGIEITKPRRNAKSVTVEERRAYRDAVIAIQTNPSFRYSDGVQYFAKQDTIHAGAGNPEHGNAAFLPWHREMVNRFEERLREHNPVLTMLYWNFTENATTGVNLFNDDFMGPSSGNVTGTLGSALPIAITRNYGVQTCTFDSDATLLGFGVYETFSDRVEAWPRNHDCSHGHVGGASGAISSPSTAVRDPFFFQLHGNVDRQWATWQRAGANPARLDPVAVYGADSSSSRINTDMSPWDGDTGLAPWTGAAAYSKTSKNPSVVFPPIYDTAPLNIPVLQPGQSVVVEIPWYPPNVNSFNCAGQSGHFCLLARIETQASAPFGMTTAETSSVSANTTNNNNVVWKNLTIVDNVIEPSLMFLSGAMIRNPFDSDAIFIIRLADRTEKRRFLLQEFADMAITLPDEILKRVARDRKSLRHLQPGELKGLDGKVLRITGKDPSFRIRMKPNERVNAQIAVQMRNDKFPRELLAEPFLFDLEQIIDPSTRLAAREDQKTRELGGVRFEIDLAQAQENRREGRESSKTPEVQLVLESDRFRNYKSLAPLAQESLHLSPGEPLNVMVKTDASTARMLRMTLEVDDETRTFDTDRMTETVKFEKPGVHSIVLNALDQNGERIQRRARVLVSEDIPPTVGLVSPEVALTARVGEAVTLIAETAPAFKRKVTEATLHVKDDDLFMGGMNLIQAKYPEVDRSQGEGPHQLVFTPDKPGMFMLQVGAVDDAGNLGVSGHVMVHVTQ
jgi:hypothetical protein